MKGCGWMLAVLLIGVALVLVGAASTPGQARTSVATQGTSASTVTIRGFNGAKEKPVMLIGAWIGTGLLVLFAAWQLTQSVPDAKAVGIPGTGCGTGLALLAVIIVVVLFFVAGALVTMGG